jgi:hypothetical protein
MDDVTVELEVIQSVGRALARLSEPEAQRRVIRWINDRFQQNLVTSAADTTRPGTPVAAEDPMLVVDELTDLFERPGFTPTLHREAVAPALPREVAAPAMHLEVAAPAMHREVAAEPEQGIDSLVRGFVTDFQRVALEWQGA